MILPPSEERTHQNGGTPPSSPYDNPRGTVTVESVDALHFLGGFQRIPSGRPRGFWGKAGPAGCGQGGRKINKKVRLFHRDCEKWYRHPRTTIHTHLPATFALDIIWHGKSNTAEDHMTRSVFFFFFLFLGNNRVRVCWHFWWLVIYNSRLRILKRRRLISGFWSLSTRF